MAAQSHVVTQLGCSTYGQEVALRATSPHYSKCIEPNNLKVPGVFDSSMVLEQLRYSGALEVVRIRQEDFPHLHVLRVVLPVALTGGSAGH